MSRKKESVDTKRRVYFLIGAAVGFVLFLIIYGFRVLDFTYDSWLLTGKDLQQHYLGWKFFRQAPWSFPLGMHDYFTTPNSISVLYTDSIPLFAILFKTLSPILPETFQYFGLFGLLCYVLNGGLASVLISRFNKSRLFCGVSSVFFILSTPVLQRLFGVLSENSRHTSLAAHFLILGAMGIWLFKDEFADRKKDAAAWAILAALCVLIQMYIIFMVGGILCGYLLNELIEKKDWKRLVIDFASFAGSFAFFFFVIGGFTSLLASGGSGYGFFSANLNTFVNPWRYSTFFGSMGMTELQYEGFAYLGLGMILLCAIALGVIVFRMVKMVRAGGLKETVKSQGKKYFAFLLPLAIVVFVFSVLAFSNLVYLGDKIFIEVHWPTAVDNLLAIIRSSGRFIWCVMYIIMLLGLFVISRLPNKRIQLSIVFLCLALQLADLYRPISRLQDQYQKEVKEDKALVTNDFWRDELGDFDKIVYFPENGYDVAQMLQIASQVSKFDDIKMSNFYLSRYMTKKAMKERDKVTDRVFKENRLDGNTLYILDYANAHKYKDKCHIYMVDNKIIAVKDPLEGLEEYEDFFVGTNTPVVEMDMSFAGIGKSFLHRGWHSMEYGDRGAWTTGESVIRVYSENAKRAKVTIEYMGGKIPGITKVKMNGRLIGEINNRKSDTVTFETKLKLCKNIKNTKKINWLFFTSEDVKKAVKAGEKDGEGIMVKKVTITYLPDEEEDKK